MMTERSPQTPHFRPDVREHIRSSEIATDPLDVTQEIPEGVWLGAALVVAGILSVAGAFILLWLLSTILIRPTTLEGWLLCSALGGILLSVAWFGLKTVRRGALMFAAREEKEFGDVRDDLLRALRAKRGEKSRRNRE